MDDYTNTQATASEPTLYVCYHRGVDRIKQQQNTVLKRENTIRRLFEFTQDENSLQAAVKQDSNSTEGCVLFVQIKEETTAQRVVTPG